MKRLLPVPLCAMLALASQAHQVKPEKTTDPSELQVVLGFEEMPPA